MPDADNSTSNPPQLPVDDAVDALLAAALGSGTEADRHKLFSQRAAAADLHMAVGVGHRLLRVRARIRELQQLAQQQQQDIETVGAPLLRAEADLVEMLEAMALVRRDAGLGNFMDVPGVGRVSTTRKAARWAIDNNELIAGLTGDDRARFIDRPPPAPPEERVKGDVVRKHLNEMLDAAAKGIEDEDEDEAMRLRKIEDAAETIAAAYPGVTYVRSEITVTTHLNDEA